LDAIEGFALTSIQRALISHGTTGVQHLDIRTVLVGEQLQPSTIDGRIVEFSTNANPVFVLSEYHMSVLIFGSTEKRSRTRKLSAIG
jgi:hypothetical protein